MAIGQLHELVLLNNVADVKTAAKNANLEEKVRGLTALDLAIMLNRADCVRILLDAGASCLGHNGGGWSPLHEATSIGNRYCGTDHSEVMEMVYRHRRQELSLWFNSKGKTLLDQISSDLNDFQFEMNWLTANQWTNLRSFRSIIPFVSRICPSDNYKVFKKGASFRFYTKHLMF